MITPARAARSLRVLATHLQSAIEMSIAGRTDDARYDRTIQVPAGKGKTIEHTIPQLVIELKTDTIRILDRSSAAGEQSDTAEPPIDEVPY